MLNNLNQFTVIRNLDMFFPTAVEFLLQVEYDTFPDLQEEILNTPIGGHFSNVDNQYITFYFHTKEYLKYLNSKYPSLSFEECAEEELPF